MSTPAYKKAQRQLEHKKAKERKRIEAFYASLPKKKKEEFKEYVPSSQPYVRDTTQYQSLKTSDVIPTSCSRRESQRYTGTLIKGIATMHKSNAVPVISQEHAEDIARMRRG